jgi:hypothetical protein
VTFSRQPAYPVDYVVEDYAGKIVYQCSIKNDRPVLMSFDVRPGTYQASCRAVGKARRDYSDADGTSLFILPGGKQSTSTLGDTPQYWARPASKGDAYILPVTLLRKIEILEPQPKQVIRQNQVAFKWSAVTGVKTYTVLVYPIDDTDHPEAVWVGNGQSKVVRGCSATLPVGLQREGWYVKPGAYSWYVMDGDWDSVNDNEHAGHIAKGSGTFSIPGGENNVSHVTTGEVYVEPKLGIKFLEPNFRSSEPEQQYIRIVGIGADSPALRAGLIPGQRIVFVNGQRTASLNDFRKALAAVLPEGKITFGISVNEDPFKPEARSVEVIAN